MFPPSEASVSTNEIKCWVWLALVFVCACALGLAGLLVMYKETGFDPDRDYRQLHPGAAAIPLYGVLLAPILAGRALWNMCRKRLALAEHFAFGCVLVLCVAEVTRALLIHSLSGELIVRISACLAAVTGLGAFVAALHHRSRSGRHSVGNPGQTTK